MNEIVQVAQGHLNRIVTPFENPKVTSTSPATTEARDNVIYIGTSGTSPVTIFITEKGSEDLALSLTLIPKQIPPREIFLSTLCPASRVETRPLQSTVQTEGVGR